MSTDHAREFEGLKQEMGLGPNLEQQALVANGPVDFSATAPAVTKADVGMNVAAENTVSPSYIAGSAMIAGETLRDPGVKPKGDIQFACTSLADTMKDTVTGLFGALKSKEPEVSFEEPQVAMAPPRPQVQPFGL